MHIIEQNKLELAILSVDIMFSDDVEGHEIDLGALTLRKDGREFILDVVSSRSIDNLISCTVMKDIEVFPDNKYDLELMDLLSDDLEAEMYVGSPIGIKEITAFVRVNGTTKAVVVRNEVLTSDETELVERLSTAILSEFPTLDKEKLNKIIIKNI
jgi:hypothetical protein